MDYEINGNKCNLGKKFLITDFLLRYLFVSASVMSHCGFEISLAKKIGLYHYLKFGAILSKLKRKCLVKLKKFGRLFVKKNKHKKIILAKLQKCNLPKCYMHNVNKQIEMLLMLSKIVTCP